MTSRGALFPTTIRELMDERSVKRASEYDEVTLQMHAEGKQDGEIQEGFEDGDD